MMLSEAVIQEQDPEGSKQVSYYRYLASAFSTANVVAKTFIFSPSPVEDQGMFPRLSKIIVKSLFKSEELVMDVVERGEEELNSARHSGTQIAGTGSEPLIVDTERMFADHPDLLKRYGAPDVETKVTAAKKQVQKSSGLVIPESRLNLDLYALQYHCQLLMQKMAELEARSAKEQASAIFLACCHHTFSDFLKVVKRFLQLLEDMASVEKLELRNELFTVDKISAEIYLLDRLLWSRLELGDLQSTNLQAVGTVKPIVDYYHFLIRFVLFQVKQKCADDRSKAETMVFLVHIADRLVKNFGDYNAASAIVAGLVCDDVAVGERDARRLLPVKIQKELDEMCRLFSPDNEYARCRHQYQKHPHPIPPIIAVIEQVRSVKLLELPKNVADLAKRVTSYCQSSSFHSQRPDIQHWLLSSSAHLLIEQEKEQEELPADNFEQQPTNTPHQHLFHEFDASKYFDPLENIDDDRIDNISGNYAKKVE